MLKYASANGSAEKIAKAIKAQVDHVVSRFGVPADEVRSRVRSVSKISGFTQRDIDEFAQMARLYPDSDEGRLCADLGVLVDSDQRGSFFRPAS
jgi:hypothetical protein